VNGTLVPENAIETQDTNVLSNGLPEILARVKKVFLSMTHYWEAHWGVVG